MSELENFLESMFLVMLIAAFLCWIANFLEKYVIFRELMKIARDECGPHFEAHKREIKWQCKLRAQSIRAGMDAGTQRAYLRSYVRRYCMVEGYD